MKTQGICCGRRGCMKIIGLTFLLSLIHISEPTRRS